MNVKEIASYRDKLYIKPSAAVRGGYSLCILLGLLTFVAGMWQGEQMRTWGSFLFNLMLFFSVALGGAAFGSMQDIVGAIWGRPVKRLHESFGLFVPVAGALILAFLLSIKFNLLGAHDFYPWIKDHNLLHHFPGKNVWLTENFMLIRDAISVVIIVYLVYWHISLTLKRDMLLVAGRDEEAHKEALESQHKLRHWAAPVMVVHALCFSLLTFDLTMSLAPTWFSTLWGGWSFAVMMQTLMATLLIFMFALVKTPVGAFFKRQQFHDIGKMLHGFTVFFAYLTFAHVLTYWYTNVPEETSYLLARMEQPWFTLVCISPVLSFLVPFWMLIPKVSKWSKWITVPICITVIVAQWITYLLVVMPEVVDSLSIPWIEVGMFFGFLGMFLAVFFRFSSRFPMVSVADPLLPAAMSDGH